MAARAFAVGIPGRADGTGVFAILREWIAPHAGHLPGARGARPRGSDREHNPRRSAMPRPHALATISTLLLPHTLLSAPLLAATIVVSPDGSGDAPDLQAAIEAAVDGDEIVLTDGVFTGPGNRDVAFLGKAVTIRSASGSPALAIVDAGELGRAFLFVDGEGPGSVLEDVGIRNGLHRAAEARGGGILCDGSSPTIVGCVIESCTAIAESEGGDYRSSGGGVAVIGGGMPSFTACVFRDNLVDATVLGAGNRGAFGGGVSARDGSTVTLDGCEIRGNDAFLGGSGGGLHVDATSSLTAIACEIRDNEAFGTGGGIRSSGALTVDGGVIADNRSRGSKNPGVGGGLGITGGTATLDGTAIAGNASTEGAFSGGYAGGLYVSSGAIATLTDALVVGNDAGAGGALYAWDATVELRTSTVARNVSGIYVYDEGLVTLDRSILWASCDSRDLRMVGEGGVVEATCSAYDPGRAPEITAIGEQVHVDPRICDLPPCGALPTDLGTYDLASDSPCLPGASPCGTRIGARGEGCVTTPTRTTSWSSIKARFEGR